ncbi:MAG: GWxTD domain-containing protein [Candidatus Aminicenantes bacterium]|nr:GWxTD domain-containing protein [Candidatus Aminicenantes bacterium]
MKKISIFFFVLLVIASHLTPEEKLLPEHKNWLELVDPIITKTEKEVFLKLKTIQERNKFIQLFWKRRDPLPDTSENEFFKEYMKRVSFADLNFGRGGVKKGSQTERGHFYLLLGPPLERHIYATSSELWPLELWYYKGEQQYGLPPYFYLIFYQPHGLGEYRLYYPGVEGPEKLVIPSGAQALTRTIAYQAMKKISGELASASLSYLPGDSTFGVSSFSSNIIISNAYSLAEKKFSDAYARSFLYYKDHIDVDYTHNFIQSSSKVKVFKNGDQFYIHWTLEPKKINFASYQGKYYSTFQLNLRIEDTQGNLVLEKEEEIPLQITPEQYKQHERQLFALQDILPVISGNYKLFFLLKSKTAKDFTSFETEVFVPQEESGPFLSNLILYHSSEELKEGQKRKLKAFAFGGKQYIINAQNDFLPQKDIGLYCQVYNLEEKNEKLLLIEILPMNVETPVQSYKKSLSEVLSPDGNGIDVRSFTSSSLKPGYYRLQVSLLDEAGEKFLTERENFVVLSQPYPVIPWIYSKMHTFPSSEQLYTLASQYFMTGKYERAHSLLAQALKMRDEPKTRLLSAKSLYALKQYKDSLAIVFPVYHATQNREAAKIIAVNYAGLEDWTTALVYLEKLMEQAAEISVLNLAAECYLNLNQLEKALPLLQKSLELNPNQARIKELEAKTKKRLEN